MTQPIHYLDEQPGRFFERSPVLLATLSPDGVLLELNARWDGRFGFSRDELRSRFLVELVSEHDRARLREALRELMRNMSAELELTLRSKYGTSHLLRWTLQWGAEDAVIYASAQELATRQTTSHEDREIYDQLRDRTGLALDDLVQILLRYEHLVCTILNPDGSIRFESPTAERFFGESARAMTNRSIVQSIHLQDREQWLEFIRRLLADDPRSSDGIDYRRHHDLGHWVPCQTRGWPVYKNQELHSLVFLTVDLTHQHHERQAHEAAMRDLEAQLQSQPLPGSRFYHSTPMGLLSINASLQQNLSEQMPMGLIAFSTSEGAEDLHVQWANPAAIEWLGLELEVIERGFGPEILGAEFERASVETLRAQDARLCALHAPPSSTNTLGSPLEGLLFGLGKNGMGVVFQTSRLNTPMVPTSPLELIEEHLDAKDRDGHNRYLFDWNHELRTPLNAILGYSELLMEEFEGQPTLAGWSNDLQKIQYAARYLNALISNFVALRRLRAGRSNVFLELVNVNDITEELVQHMEPALRAHQTPFELQIDHRVGSIYTDHSKLHQALLNLLYFTHKFARAPIRLVVRRMRDAVAFSLTTELTHPLPEHLEALLNAELIESGPETVRGPLLGVLIAQEWTRHMGGHFLYENHTSGALSLTIAMPTQVEFVPEDSRETKTILKQSPSVEVSEATLDRPQLGHPSVILVIDDDPAIHEVIKRSVSAQSCHIASALNGQRGIEMAQHLNPNAIILDVVMPNMDGWSVLAHLKQQEDLASIPVVIHSIIEDRELAQSLGAAGHLSKPIERAALLQFIDRHHHPDRLVVLWAGERDQARAALREVVMEQELSQWLDADSPSHVAELIKLYRPDVILWPEHQPSIPLDSLLDSVEVFNLKRSTLLLLGAERVGPLPSRAKRFDVRYVNPEPSYSKAQALDLYRRALTQALAEFS